MLNLEKARKAIKEKIADPLNMTVEEAAFGIVDIANAYMGQEIVKDVTLKGYDPKDFTLFAYGGAGATHCCGYAEHAGMDKIMTFPFGPVFCAFGSCNMDIVHGYEKSTALFLLNARTGKYISDDTGYEAFNDIVRGLQKKAINDMAWEGVKQEEITYSLELEIRYGAQYTPTRVMSPTLFIHSEADVKTLCNVFETQYKSHYGEDAAFSDGGIEVVLFRLKTLKAMPKMELKAYEPVGSNPDKALKGVRNIYWREGFAETNIYDYDLLECGNVVEGPAIIEQEITTYVLPKGKKYTVDKYLNGVIDNV